MKDLHEAIRHDEIKVGDKMADVSAGSDERAVLVIVTQTRHGRSSSDGGQPGASKARELEYLCTDAKSNVEQTSRGGANGTHTRWIPHWKLRRPLWCRFGSGKWFVSEVELKRHELQVS